MIKADHLLDVAGCGVSLGGHEIIKDISFSVKSGALLVIAGPNGAGKSTLLRAIAGLVSNQGQITLDGENITTLDGNARARRVSYIPQGHEVHWPLAVRTIVALGRLPHGANTSGFLSPDNEEAVRDAIAATGIAEFENRGFDTLSGGEKALVMLARALAGAPALLLADEPTAHLDLEHKLEVLELLQQTARAGRIVICVLHDLELTARFADKVLLLSEGTQTGIGSPAKLLTRKTMREIYGVRRVKNDKSTFGGHWERV